MSRAMVCDQCGTILAVNARGEADTGEEAAWLSVQTTYGHYDLCTRSCVVALMDDPDFVALMDAGAEVVASIALTIRHGFDDAAETDGGAP